jgi:hypothetical protein
VQVLGVDSCRVDFRIYWHGLVEVWFDKLIVDDEWADNLYKEFMTAASATKRKDSAVQWCSLLTNS